MCLQFDKRGLYILQTIQALYTYMEFRDFLYRGYGLYFI